MPADGRMDQKGGGAMSRYMSSRFDTLEAYVPGEQPQNKVIKLNTNENP